MNHCVHILVLCSGDLLPRVVFRMGVLAYLRSLARKSMCNRIDMYAVSMCFECM